jgi:hypothetical protein
MVAPIASIGTVRAVVTFMAKDNLEVGCQEHGPINHEFASKRVVQRVMTMAA